MRQSTGPRKGTQALRCFAYSNRNGMAIARKQERVIDLAQIRRLNGVQSPLAPASHDIKKVWPLLEICTACDVHASPFRIECLRHVTSTIQTK